LCPECHRYKNPYNEQPIGSVDRARHEAHEA
jgi:hypothetical protein